MAFKFTTTEVLVLLQILFEMVPLSSSTQVKLFAHWLQGLNLLGPLDDVTKTLIKLANILGDALVLFFFRRELYQNVAQINNFGVARTASKRWQVLLSSKFVKTAAKFFLLAGLANSVTMLVFLAKKAGKKFGLLPSLHFSYFGLKIGFLLSAMVMLSTYFCNRRNNGKISLRIALLIGLGQSLALCKGISRLGITYTIGRWLALSEKTSFIFSFLLHAQISVAYWIMEGLRHKGYYFLLPCLTLRSFVLLVVGMLLAYQLLRLTYYLITNNIFYLFALWYLLALWWL